jgi:predicted ferric reductase
VVLIAIGRHVFSKKPAEIFLQIGIYLWAGVTMLNWFWFAFRNFVIGRPFAIAVATRLSNRYPSDGLPVNPSNVLQVDITVPRKWRVRAGQYIFLSIPKLGVLTGLRGHPFMITWWDLGRKGLTISLLVKSRTGFTGELDRHTNKELRAFIDGPYGIQHKFGEYGTVIMFATGIGIAGHIPYIKDLISGYNNCEVRTRRIILVWQINKESKSKHYFLSSTILTCLRPRAVGQELDG